MHMSWDDIYQEEQAERGWGRRRVPLIAIDDPHDGHPETVEEQRERDNEDTRRERS